MAFTITHATDADGYGENLYVRHDGVMVGSLNIQHDCPEDHTVRRLGLITFIQRLLLAAGVDDVAVQTVTASADDIEDIADAIALEVADRTGA
jgi:hypothetical protein